MAAVAELEDIWLPLVDEPIGSIVEQIQRENPDVARLVESPHPILAFRTFAYIRVGLLLGQLLVDTDVDPNASESWVEQILADPKNAKTIADEIRLVAHEVASDPKLADDEPVGPDEAARERARTVFRRQLEQT